MKSETPCEPELLLFAGMNDHVLAAGLLGPLRSGEPTPKKIWEAIQTLFAAMNEVQELVTSRWRSKTRVVFASSPGYAIMPPILRFVYAMLILITEGNGEDMSQTEELKFYSGLIIRIGARCFFLQSRGLFQHGAVKNQGPPKHKLALAAVQNTRNRQTEKDLQRKEAANGELPTKAVAQVKDAVRAETRGPSDKL